MKRWTNLSIQLVGFATQVILPTFVFNPQSQMKYYALAAGITAGVQAVGAIIAHSYNPDGTSAAFPYIK